ncbi:MAG: NERD domain-containing protein [Muribaculaceae bacterium]|nr:NERD domain-containing protein [Muribaculaceae bacterium]
MGIDLILGILIGAVIVWGVVVLARLRHAMRLRRKGKAGERMVSKTLRQLKRKDNIVINDLMLPAPGGKTSQIDHIVISRRGIFVIETKSHAGRISGSEHGQYWQQHLSSSSKTFYNPLLQNASHIRAVRRILPDVDPSLFISVILFTEAWRMDIRADEIIEPRGILPDRHIARTFLPSEERKRRWWRFGKEVRLDERQRVLSLEELIPEINRRKRVLDREEIAELAEKIYAANITERGNERQHREYARETSRNINAGIRRGVCPRCGGRLIVRKSKTGEFVGCENYPECRFTCSIDRLH